MQDDSKFHSVNGLSLILGNDRRTIKLALRDIPPEGCTERGYRGWTLETARRAVRRRLGIDRASPEEVEVLFQHLSFNLNDLQ